MTMPAVLSAATRGDAGGADVVARSSAAAGLTISTRVTVVDGTGVSTAGGASRDKRGVSAEGTGTRQFGIARSVTGTSAAAAMAHVQRKWRAEADARRIAIDNTHARLRTTLARRQKPKSRGIRSPDDTSGSFLACAFDQDRKSVV